MTILAYTGLRWSELVGLRVGDVDLSARRLYVRQAAPEVEGRIVVGPPKTRAAVRTVPLPQVVIDALKPRIVGRTSGRARRSPHPTAASSDRTTGAATPTGTRALKTTHLAPLTIHDLRHTYASLARASGADLRYVQKTMGHSTPTVTANIYSDLYSDELDQVATNLDRLHVIGRDSRERTGTGHTESSIECRHRVGAGQNLVARAGIEPATFRFSGGRSYRLSYLAERHRTRVPRRDGDPDGT